jgi:hypothetical protein
VIFGFIEKNDNEKLDTLEETFDKVSRIIEYFVTKKTTEGIDVNRI